VRTSFWPGLVVGILAAVLGSAAHDGQPAQLPRVNTTYGSVSGTAYCADTNLPARLASIYLD
jgi:hypothetical protein